MVAGAAALYINIDTDGRPLPIKKRWRTLNKLCAARFLQNSDACAPFFHLPYL